MFCAAGIAYLVREKFYYLLDFFNVFYQSEIIPPRSNLVWYIQIELLAISKVVFIQLYH